MLILTRKVGETIIINDNIHITVLDTAGTQVRIGVNAPEDVKVYRSELYERLQVEKKSLAKNRISDDITCEYLCPPY